MMTYNNLDDELQDLSEIRKRRVCEITILSIMAIFFLGLAICGFILPKKTIECKDSHCVGYPISSHVVEDKIIYYFDIFKHGDNLATHYGIMTDKELKLHKKYDLYQRCDHDRDNQLIKQFKLEKTHARVVRLEFMIPMIGIGMVMFLLTLSVLFIVRRSLNSEWLIY